MARRHTNFVIGFISQRRLEGVGSEADTQSYEDFLVLSPGVGINTSGDSLGQRYRTPHEVICESGADVIIVGRGIYGQTNPSGDPDDVILKQTLLYKDAGSVQRNSAPTCPSMICMSLFPHALHFFFYTSWRAYLERTKAT